MCKTSLKLCAKQVNFFEKMLFLLLRAGSFVGAPDWLKRTPMDSTWDKPVICAMRGCGACDYLKHKFGDTDAYRSCEVVDGTTDLRCQDVNAFPTTVFGDGRDPIVGVGGAWAETVSSRINDLWGTRP